MKLALVLLTSSLLWGDAGVLIPSTGPQPDPRVLTLDEMQIRITVDNGHARVQVQQIFANHTGSPIEGNYVFALPGRALLSDFAVWDDATRIPGVILERKRAEELYNDIRAQALDPGLLQMGERDADEARRTSVFSARVAPIPAWGTKRVEIEYQERLQVEQGVAILSIPLKPDVYRAQTAARLNIEIDLKSAHTVREFTLPAKAYPIPAPTKAAKTLQAKFDGANVILSEDFVLQYTLDAQRDALEILTYRQGTGPGYFEASALVGLPPAAEVAAPKTVVALFDTSLSMQWEKLERSFRALEALLRSLKPADQFNLLLYNDRLIPFAPAPQAATPDAVEKALAFVRAENLRGGTNLQAALDAALNQTYSSDPYLVLLSDLGSTRGLLNNGKLDAWYNGRWQATARHPRTYVFAVGDDANQPLARMLARHDGVAEFVRSTEPVEFKLNAFLSKIGRRPAAGLQLGIAPANNTELVYPLEDSVFPGSLQTWVGQYRQPATTTFSVRQTRASVPLPAQNAEHPHLPRAWAKARVDALLEKIDREGEDTATIDEIIRLSREFKFVTPYTSFLAAPRALLRPRLIRPGDPVLRVHTDPSITSVVAMFPFGDVKKLRYLDQEDTWQTRFLAPKDMADGTYKVQLVLRDRDGRTYREAKTFIIASKPPVVQVKLARSQVRRGDTVDLRVSASESTRTIVARLPGAAPVYIRWNPDASANTGALAIPTTLPAGRYKLTVTAEDFAHNIGTREVEIDVLP